MHGKFYFSNQKCMILFTITMILPNQTLEVFLHSILTPKSISIGCCHFAFFNYFFLP
jgi:hypothetical protein